MFNQLHRNKKYICILLCMLALHLTACGGSTRHGKGVWYPNDPLVRKYYDFSLVEPYVDENKFISGNMLSSHFGDFESLDLGLTISPLYTSDGEPPMAFADHYTYRFSKESGSKYDLDFSVSVLQKGVIYGAERDPGADPLVYSEPTGISTGDLRTADSPGIHRVGDIQYEFYESQDTDTQGAVLGGIRWGIKNYSFYIDLSKSSVEEFALDDGGYMAQLLREETAEEAISDFNRDISRSLLWGRIYRNWLPWIVPGVIVVSVAATFLLFRHRRKRKNTGAVPIPEETQTEKEE